jgi:hypothetical protein
MNAQIHTNEKLSAVGRNGRMKQVGLDVFTSDWLEGDNILHISPINTKCVGNCEIQMDKQLAQQLIPILKDFVGGV